MQVLTSLDEIVDRYDVLFCDVWGVIHNGQRYFRPAAAALTRAKAAGAIVLLFSNVPKPKGPIPAQLDRIGFPREAWSEVITSGDAIRAELAKLAPGPMYKIGPPEDAPLWADLGLQFSDLAQARFIGISGLNYETREDAPDRYGDILREAKARDLSMLCANPDIVVRWGENLIWCAGAVARDYEAIGGRVVMAGKPYPPIYDLARRQAAQIAQRDIASKRILAIGDGVDTDVKGANREGLDCLFVASGMHGEALTTDGALDPDKVEATLAAGGAHARYVMRELA